MCTRRLTFVLVWLVGVLHAQTSDQPCHPPILDHGFISLHQSTYPHDTNLTYGCDFGYKPVVEGWWAKVKCLNGKWSQEPKCIDQNACLSPNILHAGHVESSEGWYEHRTDLMITCDAGYEHKGSDTSARCVDGGWTPMPVCEEREDACGEPPQVPHAVVLNEEYQTVFAANSQVQYQCELGYITEDGNNKKTISCEAGHWTKGPTCTRSSTDSGTNEQVNDRHFTTIDRCGQVPVVENGVVVQTEETYFKYKCAAYFKVVGSDTVQCYSDGLWSQEPNCKASYCTVNTRLYSWLINVGQKYIEDGVKLKLECQTYWGWRKYSYFHCTDGRTQATSCCTDYDHDMNYC